MKTVKYRLHLYETDSKNSWLFPKFPVNSYETSDKAKIIEQLSDLLNNHQSGISKILIETTEFGNYDSVTESQSIQNLD